jgi:PAS domain S-box-containing protein
MFHVTDEINGKIQFDELIHPQDAEKFNWFLNTLLNGENVTAFAELRIVPKAGMSFWSELNASLLLDSNGVAKGFIIIMRDITGRKMAEAQLLQFMDELDESNRTKDKLFSIIAHDLKSPFSALLGTSNAMVQEANLEDPDIRKFRKFSKIINDSANRTYNLLVNLLDWSRLQSNRIEVNPECLNLADIIMENVDIGQTMAMSKNIMLKCSTPDNCPLVSDKAIINTILRNLISNAIKYTPQNGLVTVSLDKKGDMYLISVSDNGLGIPAENLEKLFKLETIQSTPGTNNEKGTGLGLVLCKDFVNKLGGEIWVKSAYGRGGATFTFSLKDLSTD